MERKKLLCSTALILAMILLVFPNATSIVNGESEGWQIDVYTQKQPHSGVGLNQSSDSFGPTEAIFLYANVTFNAYPVQSKSVFFQVFGPANPVQNITLSTSAVTGDDGVAETDFSIPWPLPNPEAIVFGYWTVTAYIENACDFLVFRVGWIVDIVSINLLDQDPPRGRWLQVNVSLQNIATTPKNATLTIVLSDSSNQPIGATAVRDFIVDERGADFSARFQIPEWATLGVGTLNASALTPDGAPYGPSKSAVFFISLLGDLNGDGKVDVRDVAVVSSAFGSYPGHPKWNPLADINKDGKVNVKDVALVSRAFGSENPRRDP